MARALRDEHMTPADELRGLLTDSEKLIVNLRGQGAGALELLQNMDRIAELWPALEAAGVDLRAEAGRWETLQASVHQNAPRLLRELRAVGGLAATRAQYHAAGEAASWWYLDEEVRDHNRRRALRFGLVALGIVAVGAAAVLVIRTLFPVDPRLQASMSRLMSGQQKIQNQADYQGALADFQDAASLKPDEPDAWLWLGAAQQKLGDQAAVESFRRAHDLLRDELQFRLSRAPVYLALGMPEEARGDLDAVLASDPENPQAYYFLAAIYESKQQLVEAATALQRAAELADKRGEAQLTALARFRLGVLLQQLQAQPLVSPTPP